MFVASGNTHKGKLRQVNQDAILMDDRSGIWIVADGMGGHNAGEIAAQWVCKHLPQTIKQQKNSVEQAIQQVHEQIKRLGLAQPAYLGMGSTMIMALQQEHKLSVYWSGDCRAYLLSCHECKLVSKDHSWVQRLLDLNIIDKDEALHHPKRHVVTSCLGGTHLQPEIETIQLTLHTKDKLLLCSDGLYNELSEDQVIQIVKRANNASEAVETLIEKANQRGGRDNISAVLIARRD